MKIFKYITAIFILLFILITSVFFIIKDHNRSINFFNPIFTQLFHYKTNYFISIADTKILWRTDKKTLEFNISEINFYDINKELLGNIPMLDLNINLFAPFKRSALIENIQVRYPSIYIKAGQINQSSDNNIDYKSFLKNIAILPKNIHFSKGSLFLTEQDKTHLLYIDNLILKNEDTKLYLSYSGTFDDHNTRINIFSKYEDNDYHIDANFSNLPIFSDITKAFEAVNMDYLKKELFITGKAGLLIRDNLSLKDLNIEIKDGFGRFINNNSDIKSLSVNAIKGKLNLIKDSKLLDTERILINFDNDASIVLDSDVMVIKDKNQIKFNVGVTNMPVDYIQFFWPKTAVADVRKWVVNNITKGLVDKADLSFTFIHDQADYNYVDDSFVSHIKVSNTNLNYEENFPAITNINAEINISDKLIVDIKQANLLDTVIQNGLVTITDLSLDDVILTIAANTEGQARDLLAFIPSETLEKLNQTMHLETLKGKALGEVKIDLPIAENINFADINFNIKMQLINASITQAFDKFNLTKGKLNIDFDGKELLITGTSMLNNYRHLKLETNINLTEEDNYNISLQTSLGEAEIKRLELDKMLIFERGFIPINVTINSQNNVQDIKIYADLNSAAFSLGYIGAKKQFESTGSLNSHLTINNNDLTVNSFNFKSQDGDINGSASFSLQPLMLKRLDVKKFSLWHNDFTASYQHNINNYNLSLTGNNLNLSNSNFQDLTKNNNTKKLGKLVTMNMKKIMMKNDQEFFNVVGKMDCNPYNCKFVRFDAMLDDNKFAKINLTRSGKQSKINLISDDASIFLRALDIYNNVKRGRLEINLISSDQFKEPYEGELNIKNFNVTKTSILSKILTLSSVIGITRILNNDINFSQLESKFSYQDNIIKVKESRAGGAELSLTIQGNIDLNKSRLDLAGVVIPELYGFNRIITKIPLFGKILGGTKGGFIAANYKLRGEFNNISTIVNPLSIFTFGVLKNIFEEGKAVEENQPIEKK